MIIDTKTPLGVPFRIGNYLKRNRAEYALFLAVRLLQVLLALALPILLSRCIDQISGKGEALSISLTWFFALTLLEFISTVVVNEWNVRLSNRIAFQIEFETMRHLKHVPYQAIRGYDDAYLTQRVNNDSVMAADFIVEKLPFFATDLLLIAVMIPMTCRINLRLGLLLIGFVSVYLLSYRLTRGRLSRQGAAMFETRGNFFALLSNQLLNLLVIRVNAWYEETDWEFVKTVESFFKTSVTYLRTVNLISAGNALLTRIAFGAAIVLLAGGVKSGAVSIGTLSIAVIYIQLLLTKLQSATEFGRIREEYRIAKNRLIELNAFELEKNGDTQLAELERIEAKNLTVSYDSAPIFSGLDVTLEKGNLYVIRGENGSGKTTLINTLLGVLEADSGGIFYNGIPLERIDHIAARKNLFAVTSQEPYLYSGTLRENIAYGSGKSFNPETADPLVREFLSFCETRAQGFDTPIQGKNAKLSGGEKQKISLSRSLIKHAGVMIFDEPTNALDAGSVDAFLAYLQKIKQGRIVIVISHHASILAAADRLISLEKA